MSDRELRGVGVSPGVAFAPALAVRWTFPEIPERTVGPAELEAEVARLHQAVQAVSDQLDALRVRTLQRAGPEAAGIFDAQIMMAEDADFLASVETLIRMNLLSAESAYEFRALELRNAWQNAPPVVPPRSPGRPQCHPAPHAAAPAGAHRR